jgi:predicted secreted protein
LTGQKNKKSKRKKPSKEFEFENEAEHEELVLGNDGKLIHLGNGRMKRKTHYRPPLAQDLFDQDESFSKAAADNSAAPKATDTGTDKHLATTENDIKTPATASTGQHVDKPLASATADQRKLHATYNQQLIQGTNDDEEMGVTQSEQSERRRKKREKSQRESKSVSTGVKTNLDFVSPSAERAVDEDLSESDDDEEHPSTTVTKSISVKRRDEKYSATKKAKEDSTASVTLTPVTGEVDIKNRAKVSTSGSEYGSSAGSAAARQSVRKGDDQRLLAGETNEDEEMGVTQSEQSERRRKKREKSQRESKSVSTGVKTNLDFVSPSAERAVDEDLSESDDDEEHPSTTVTKSISVKRHDEKYSATKKAKEDSTASVTLTPVTGEVDIKNRVKVSTSGSEYGSSAGSAAARQSVRKGDDQRLLAGETNEDEEMGVTQSEQSERRRKKREKSQRESKSVSTGVKTNLDFVSPSAERAVDEDLSESDDDEEHPSTTVTKSISVKRRDEKYSATKKAKEDSTASVTLTPVTGEVDIKNRVKVSTSGSEYGSSAGSATARQSVRKGDDQRLLAGETNEDEEMGVTQSEQSERRRKKREKSQRESKSVSTGVKTNLDFVSPSAERAVDEDLSESDDDEEHPSTTVTKSISVKRRDEKYSATKKAKEDSTASVTLTPVTGEVDIKNRAKVSTSGSEYGSSAGSAAARQSVRKGDDQRLLAGETNEDEEMGVTQSEQSERRRKKREKSQRESKSVSTGVKTNLDFVSPSAERAVDEDLSESDDDEEHPSTTVTKSISVKRRDEKYSATKKAKEDSTASVTLTPVTGEVDIKNRVKVSTSGSEYGSSAGSATARQSVRKGDDQRLLAGETNEDEEMGVTQSEQSERRRKKREKSQRESKSVSTGVKTNLDFVSPSAERAVDEDLSESDDDEEHPSTTVTKSISVKRRDEKYSATKKAKEDSTASVTLTPVTGEVDIKNRAKVSTSGSEYGSSAGSAAARQSVRKGDDQRLLAGETNEDEEMGVTQSEQSERRRKKREKSQRESKSVSTGVKTNLDFVSPSAERAVDEDLSESDDDEEHPSTTVTKSISVKRHDEKSSADAEGWARESRVVDRGSRRSYRTASSDGKDVVEEWSDAEESADDDAHGVLISTDHQRMKSLRTEGVGLETQDLTQRIEVGGKRVSRHGRAPVREESTKYNVTVSPPRTDEVSHSTHEANLDEEEEYLAYAPIERQYVLVKADNIKDTRSSKALSKTEHGELLNTEFVDEQARKEVNRRSKRGWQRSTDLDHKKTRTIAIISAEEADKLSPDEIDDESFSSSPENLGRLMVEETNLDDEDEEMYNDEDELRYGSKRSGVTELQISRNQTNRLSIGRRKRGQRRHGNEVSDDGYEETGDAEDDEERTRMKKVQRWNEMQYSTETTSYSADELERRVRDKSSSLPSFPRRQLPTGLNASSTSTTSFQSPATEGSFEVLSSRDNSLPNRKRRSRSATDDGEEITTTTTTTTTTRTTRDARRSRDTTRGAPLNGSLKQLRSQSVESELTMAMCLSKYFQQLRIFTESARPVH